MRPVTLLALLLIACTGCASAPDSGAPAGKNVREILVLPLNVVVPLDPQIEGHTGKLVAMWNDYLVQQDRQVRQLGGVEARRALRRVIEHVKSLDPQPEDRFETATKALAVELAARESFDALIIPSVMMRPARPRGLSAEWDGARQRLEFADTQHGPHEFKKGRGLMGGTIAAASLHVRVVDRRGVELFDRVTGLELRDRIIVEQIGNTRRRMKTIEEKRWRIRHVGGGDAKVYIDFKRRPDFLNDPKTLRDGIARALYPFLPIVEPEDG